MALYNGFNRVEGSRSSTALVKSGHASPAGDWLLDPKFKAAEMSSIFNQGVLFNYQYGGPGMEDVTIPKGRFVGVGTPVKSFYDGTFKSVMTLPGMALNNNVIGMVPYNITKDYLEQDQFGGNKPTIITQEYVTLPYMPSVSPSTDYNVSGVLAEELALSVNLKMPWGAVIGPVTNGDFVKATPSGRACKWTAKTITQDDTSKDITITGDDQSLILGQIMEMDLNGEPWGWLKWMLWDESSKLEDDGYINQSGNSSLPSDGGYPFDATYRDGYLDLLNKYQSQFTQNPTGVPGLHDGSGNYTGFGKNDTEYTNITLGAAPNPVSDNTLMAFQALDFAGGKLTNLLQGVVVKINDVTITDATRYSINYQTGVITVKLMAVDAGHSVKATYKAQHFGTPSYLDFKGVVGSVSVLLMK